MQRSPPRRESGRRYSGPRGNNLNPIWVIIGLNLIVLIIANVSDDAVLRLGLYPDLFWSRPWTIITAMFTHVDIWHFIFNMLTLFFFGRFLIMLVGQNWFLLVYFIGGIVGNILFLTLESLVGDPLIILIAIGASGAIYAIAGALVVMVPNIRVALWGIIPMPLWVAILVVGVILSFLPGVAWQAHLGGLAVGLITGYYFRRKRLAIY